MYSCPDSPRLYTDCTSLSSAVCKSYRGKIFVPTAQNAGMKSKLRANGGPAITKALLNGAGVNIHALRCPGLNQGLRQSGRDLFTYMYLHSYGSGGTIFKSTNSWNTRNMDSVLSTNPRKPSFLAFRVLL